MKYFAAKHNKKAVVKVGPIKTIYAAICISGIARFDDYFGRWG